MHEAMQYVYWALDFIRGGFQQVNAILGLLIAIYFAYSLSDWKKLWVTAFGALLTHLVAMVMLPVLDHGAAFRLPPIIELDFLKKAVALYLGYVIAIAVFFFVKKNVLSGSGGKAHAH
jgi:hypothetical protein